MARKTILIFTMVLTLVLVSLLAACGGAAPTTTKAPATTSAAPATTSAAPATTTKAPATTSAAPATTTKAPATTSAAPATTSAAPATTTKAPATTSAAPATTTTAAPAAGNTITWEQALNPEYLGKEVTVTGPVVQVVQAFGTKVNVYLGKEGVPDGDKQVGFCILVQDPSLLPSVKDVKGINAAWKGKTLEVTGTILVDERHGTIQITATDDSQVKVK